MGKNFEFKIPGKNETSKEILGSVIDRRQFIRYGFNTAAGVLAATFGVIGFAAILMPGGGGGGGASNGCTNTGGGGGGNRVGTAGSGGSGIIIIKHTTADATPSVSGGNVVLTCGSHTIRIFTGSGTFVP